MQICENHFGEWVYKECPLPKEKDALLHQLKHVKRDFFFDETDGFTHLGTVADVYPELTHFKDILYDYLYDYTIFESPQGTRILVNHIANNWTHFVCDGSRETVTAHMELLFQEKVIS